jgi:hypothetical protein
VCTANAIKYILRWKKKNGIQDVKKAIWYLTHLVEHLENKEREEHAEFDEELLNKRAGMYTVANTIDIKSDHPITFIEVLDPKTDTVKKPKPGCDKCEISECKFLEDPFMNPPYNVLWDKWKEQKETIKKLMSDKKEMQDSIDFLASENADLQEKLDKAAIENHEILMNLHCLICDDLNNYSYIDKNSNNPEIIYKACKRAGIDIQKIKDRYFKED